MLRGIIGAGLSLLSVRYTDRIKERAGIFFPPSISVLFDPPSRSVERQCVCLKSLNDVYRLLPRIMSIRVYRFPDNLPYFVRPWWVFIRDRSNHPIVLSLNS